MSSPTSVRSGAGSSLHGSFSPVTCHQGNPIVMGSPVMTRLSPHPAPYTHGPQPGLSTHLSVSVDASVSCGSAQSVFETLRPADDEMKRSLKTEARGSLKTFPAIVSIVGANGAQARCAVPTMLSLCLCSARRPGSSSVPGDPGCYHSRNNQYY